MFVSENETGNEVTRDGKRESETESRGREKELPSYHVNEALLDPVQCGSQSAADKTQA